MKPNIYRFADVVDGTDVYEKKRRNYKQSNDSSLRIWFFLWI